MKTELRYIATDGAEFKTADECSYYESTHVLKKSIDHLVRGDDGIAHTDEDRYIDFVLRNKDQLLLRLGANTLMAAPATEKTKDRPIHLVLIETSRTTAEFERHLAGEFLTYRIIDTLEPV